MTPEQTLDWLAQQHFDQCREERPIQDWIRKMKSQLPEQQEPVAKVKRNSAGQIYIEWRDGEGAITSLIGAEFYTTPPYFPTERQRKPWVGLTDEEIQTLWRSSEHMTVNQVCRAIEAKLKAKNERKEKNTNE